ncbi:M1 family metallopeptidase [Cognatitamlana onchidii]|uniref:M1 family metallopeptidase n=1 Tax=Cognatitamlana onchidii TaxID=2562860 RepID=UPI0010A5FF39|nr:M1 family metallopeptidase [Algibacter onchidii]
MRIRFFSCVLFLPICIASFGQNKIDLKAVFDIGNKQIKISQTIRYENTTSDELKVIYLSDWNNSYSTKQTPLAIRLAEEYNNSFHLAKSEDRGFSVIKSIQQNGQNVLFEHLENQNDIIKVELKEALKPNDAYVLNLDYLVQIPNSKFTSYGITNKGDLNLRYWYITPAIYDGEWQYYSNKNLDDLFIPKADITLNLEFPLGYTLTSDLDVIKTTQNTNSQVIELKGNDRNSNKLFLSKRSNFETLDNNELEVISDINYDQIDILEKVLIIEKVTKFISEHFGDYPQKKLLLSHIDYEKDPIYGLNFLPKFIKPYPSNFQYELKVLKIALHNFLENTLLVNPRNEQWLLDGIQIFYAMKYVDSHYPDMKFLGTIADAWLIRSFHAADMKFNDKYVLAYMLMARSNRDQELSKPTDSLLKFNRNIANKYKAGVGLKYLDDFVNRDVVETGIESFVKDNKLKPTTTKQFESYLKSLTDKNIDWFFTDYLNTSKKIDFKIKNVSETEDSITLTIKNKRNNNMPVSLYSLKNDSIVSKIWIENIFEEKKVTIPRNNANKLVLNYENTIPEFNLRDNWKSLKGFFFNNKPLQFRLFKDIEDPYYNQVFLMPIIEFNNIYDGITLGVKAYNKTLLKKRFNYKIAPKYSIGSNALTGNASVLNTHYLENRDLYSITYGISGGYNSYAEDLFVRKITPGLTFRFRESNDLRSNKRKTLLFRYVDINRDKDINNILTSDEPNYSVFNARYIHSNDNLITFHRWYTDFQLGNNFSKLAFNYEFRKLFENNRQLNLRMFAGTFLSNKTDSDSDYFSFALDRPTDYLFDYNYLGRSEDTGLFSQQYIPAEGGFKSKLDPPFANQWMTTLNASTTLWRYILLYGDLGFVKNRFESSKFVYDSGVRIDLVTDYFEIYFPLYSNLGWEVGLPDYAERIRFRLTLDPKSLLGLFRRRWF